MPLLYAYSFSLKIMFSLLHGTIFPHFGQLTIFPANNADSNDFLFPKAIGDLNMVLQLGHTTNVSAMISFLKFYWS
jgi:hypothetical protein